ncbi:oligopeptide/dipeptide ABC transporter, ATP-binding protein [Caldisphaera lagunensis DSM 15908]|uniref:Oligopeptide/dipeptide ABC transporter, ATP-binding protein n=1 Tax=Caldisphaera lagunensis (strain DSM 15908 / JCM 11604 / ANMR 0165 / IC-154) TaxID=1056495 RepID=L0ACK5_CALLD|nr:ABC transporter ATP-binding protein [Caldisphaera lagunensis]AFZ70790.1 oligopeptide/dipeptide ABC transporter, ATP-binding protein [Caldisphaera lagunensis DSM 15908]
MPILSIKNLSIHFYTPKGVRKAVDRVDLELNKGEVIGIAGESGSGKSTLALGIMRLITYPGRIVSGEIYFNGENILKMSEDEFNKKIRWKKIAMIFQGSMNGFTPVFKIGDQIREVMEIHEYNGDYESRIKELLNMVELDESVANKYPHELSGGMRQRAFIAMALALNPEILICDEPTTALDVITQAKIINLLKKLKKELNLSIIFITHDLALLSEISDKLYIMYAGGIMERGNSLDIYKNPKHPYTQLLIEAIADINKDYIKGIPGFMPDLANLPSGCRFSNRCPFVMDICKKKEPELKRLEGDRYVSCWLY